MTRARQTISIQRVQRRNKQRRRGKYAIKKEREAVSLSERFMIPRVRTKQLAEFTRQLATLLEARLSLTRALEILSAQTPNQRLKKILLAVLTDIREGESFSTCLQKEPAVFNELFVSLVEVGERAGILAKTLNRLAIYLEKMANLRRKILTAMTYPAVILLVAVCAVAFLLVAVVPTFAQMFHEFGGQLPGPTQALLDSGIFLKNHGWVLLLALAILFVLLARMRKSPAGALLLDTVSLRIPVIGHLLKKNFLARFCRTLGTLLSSGVSLLPSLEVAQNVSGNQVFRGSVLRMKNRVIQGKSLLELDEIEQPFTSLIAQMIKVGEETGELDSMLLNVARFYEDELDATIEAMTSVIEPVIIVFLGVVLGGTMAALYLQLFDLVNVIQ